MATSPARNNAPAPPAPSFFEATPALPPTVIFHLTSRFKADADPRRVNLGVGAYRDASLAPVVFASVRKAEAAVVAAGTDKEYLPIAGLPELRVAAARLLFGASCAALAAGRVATVQTLSGTGSLTLGAHLLRRLRPEARMFCSDPTWENHGKVVADAGAGGPGGLEYYRYYDSATRSLDEAGLLADLGALPEGSVVLLHACAHNPTGEDPTRAQRGAGAALMQKRRLLPWFDIAYQGFASGELDADAWAVRHFVTLGFEMLVSQSFAKNFGLYAERVGALHVVTPSKGAAAAVVSQLEAIARPMYSNPPAHGARVVARILGDPALASVRRALPLARAGASCARASPHHHPHHPTPGAGVARGAGGRAGARGRHAQAAQGEAARARHARRLGAHHNAGGPVQLHGPHQGAEHAHGGGVPRVHAGLGAHQRGGAQRGGDGPRGGQHTQVRHGAEQL